LLWAERFGDRIPGEARISAPIQNAPGAHPASYTMDTGSSPGIKRPGLGDDHPPPSRAEVTERVEICLYFMACSGVNFTLFYPTVAVLSK